MGGVAVMIGAVGMDAFGDEMRAALSQAGVDISGVFRRAVAPSGTALITLDATGQNQIIVAGGANDTLTSIDVEAQAATIEKSQAVIVQLETTMEATEAALRLARAAGVMTVLNPAPYVHVSEKLLSLCDWIIPNESEASQLSGVVVKDAASAAKAACLIKGRLRCPNVLVTLGANGLWLDTGSYTGHIASFAVEAVDTVGAGDTFIGTFVARLTEGAKPPEAARFGCAAAAIAVTRRGAQASIPTRVEVDDFLRQHL
jgi:ribokinase